MMRSHGLMQTEAQVISYMDLTVIRLTPDLKRPGVDTHHDGSQGERVSPFFSVPPVVQKLNELWLHFLYL